MSAARPHRQQSKAFRLIRAHLEQTILINFINDLQK